VYYFITDHLGTPMKMMNETGGVVWSADYRLFGELSAGNATVENKFRFPGQYYDPETELHYNYHRFYQPKMGRYITPDPVGLEGGLNPYLYVNANPVMGVDPFGLLNPVDHFMITIIEALRAGRGIRESFVLAWKTVLVDFETDPQDVSCEETKKHGMAGKISKEGRYQTYEEAITASEAFIKESIASGDLFYAVHATQDLATSVHKGEEWRRYGPNLETLQHILGDFFGPSVEKAHRQTRELFK
jgi:RHS repeat-associated protein